MVAKRKPAAKAESPKRHKLVTPEFIGSYVHLDQPHSASEDVEPTYSMLIVLDPENDEHADFISRVEDEIESLIESKWGDRPRKFQSPLKEGEDLGDSDELQGKICINVRSKTKPGILDAEGQRIVDVAEECYSGATFIASISGYAWEHKVGGKGVSFGLDNVMKRGDGDPLGGGRAKAEDDFADYVSPRRKKAQKDDEKGSSTRSSRGKVTSTDDDDDDGDTRRTRRTRR